MHSYYHPALKRMNRRSLPSGHCASSGPQTWVPELCPSAAASVWKLDQNSDVPPASSPSFAGSGHRSWDMVIVWIFFLSAVVCVKNRLCPGRRSEGGGESHLQGQRLGRTFPKVTQAHHSNNPNCSFIFTSEVDFLQTT